MNSVIEFRWLQRESDEGTQLGKPVLQVRTKFDADGDGHFSEKWGWSEWETVPTVVETVY